VTFGLSDLRIIEPLDYPTATMFTRCRYAQVRGSIMIADEREVTNEHQSTCDNFWYVESGRRRSACKVWQQQYREIS